MRQWDTKKQFKPDYRRVAKVVFLGWLSAARQPNWRWHLGELWSGLSGLTAGVLGVAFGAVLLASSPVSFPLLCLAHRMTRRRERLSYIRRNRKADADL